MSCAAAGTNSTSPCGGRLDRKGASSSFSLPDWDGPNKNVHFLLVAAKVVLPKGSSPRPSGARFGGFGGKPTNQKDYLEKHPCHQHGRNVKDAIANLPSENRGPPLWVSAGNLLLLLPFVQGLLPKEPNSSGAFACYRLFVYRILACWVSVDWPAN